MNGVKDIYEWFNIYYKYCLSKTISHNSLIELMRMKNICKWIKQLQSVNTFCSFPDHRPPPQTKPAPPATGPPCSPPQPPNSENRSSNTRKPSTRSPAGRRISPKTYNSYRRRTRTPCSASRSWPRLRCSLCLARWRRCCHCMWRCTGRWGCCGVPRRVWARILGRLCCRGWTNWGSRILTTARSLSG